MKSKMVASLTAEKRTVYDQAEGLLNRMGVEKKGMLPGIWNAFKLQTAQLLMDGYTEQYIMHKLQELAISRVNALKEMAE